MTWRCSELTSQALKSLPALGKSIQGEKYTLLDFWASWCGPCQKEMPTLKAAYKAFASKGFEIISISTDKIEADWHKALQEEQPSCPNFLDRNNIADSYKIKLIPSTFLIDEHGVVIEEGLRGQALLDRLAELFP